MEQLFEMCSVEEKKRRIKARSVEHIATMPSGEKELGLRFLGLDMFNRMVEYQMEQRLNITERDKDVNYFDKLDKMEGIYEHDRIDNKWEVRDGNDKHLGLFHNLSDAIDARLDWEDEQKPL